jgi:hypothetical protein
MFHRKKTHYKNKHQMGFAFKVLVVMNAFAQDSKANLKNKRKTVITLCTITLYK